MKRIIVSLVLSLVIAPAALSAFPGDITKTVALPVANATGIAWTGSSLWVADRKIDSFVEISITDGSLLRKIPSPGWFPAGLAWDGKLLWSTDPTAGKIYATDLSSGLTVKTMDAPSSGISGIAWNNGELWVCDNREDRIMRIDPGDGTTITSFPAPAKDPRGIVFGNGYLWCSDRLRDQIYMISPENGMVINIIEAPGPFTWGLEWKDGSLLACDYQRDSVFQLVAGDGQQFRTYDPRTAEVDFQTEAVAMGPGSVTSLDIFLADPKDRPNQKLLEKTVYSPSPEFKKDNWGQSIAAFHFDDIQTGTSVSVSMKARIETSAIRYFIVPEKVGSKIPAEISKLYLADGVKYDIHNPYITKIVKDVVGDETNIYWKARKLYQYLIANMEYKLAGGWNTAPRVLERKNGSCSEYSFSYVALCRAAGVPARYVGSLVVRGDDASYDDVFHRWNEVYLPGYGWVPVDANAGDKPLPADQGSAFGGISNRFLVTTESGGDSDYLGWGYDYETHYVTSGKCSVHVESIAEWDPIETK